MNQPGDIGAAHAIAHIRAAEAGARASAGGGPDALMRRAAAGLATACLEALRQRRGRVVGARVVILAGTGDNGGDALLAGARLRARGVAVTTVPIRGAGHPLGAAGRAVVGADLVLDGVSGLGGRPGLASAVADLLTAVPPSALVVAVDLPSGLDPASGRADAPHVRADRTVTFGALKPALLLPPAAHAAGVVHVVDIGLGPYLPPEPLVRRLTGADVGARWPTPRAVDHKYTRGVLGVIAGSVTYPGAAVLACTGAVRAGAGIVKYTGPAAVAARVIAARPEVVARPGSVNAYLLGSGVFADPAQDAAVLAALGSGLPCVVDAGALEQCVLARRDGAPTGPTARSRAPGDRMLLTPHAGELARLLPLVGPGATREDVEADPAGHARRLARAVDVTVLVKGPITLVVPPDGPIYSQAEGTPWLASAGTGDVLAGIAGALLASGLGAAPAGALAATVHGRAGVRVGGPLTALGVADAVPEVLADLLVDPFGG